MEKLYAIYKRCEGISTDSRKVAEGSLFFALKGDNFDGNRFALAALEQGARYAVVSDPAYKENPNCFLVEDTTKALQALAKYHRRQFDIPFVGITGTNGKTTTKELVSAVLDTHFKTHFTKGNFNNHIGVPLTLLNIAEDTEIAVIEMGANHIGEIDFLCNIAEPTHGLITNIGKAHLEGFGSLEGVKQTKSELYRFLGKGEGTLFLNIDQPFLPELAAGVDAIVTYGTSDKAEHRADLLATAPFVRFKMGGVEVDTQLFGRYNLDNAMTAMTVGLHFGVPLAKIQQALANYVPSNNRSQIVKRGNNVFYLDAYNANPTSMQLAVENFATLSGERKIAILGDMLELGEYSQEEHQRMGDLVRKLQNEKKLSAPCILVGKEFEAVKAEGLEWFATTKDLKTWFDKQDFERADFLVKGSRGIGLEKLL